VLGTDGSTHCIRPQTVAEATVVAQDQKEADTPKAEKKKEDSSALLAAEGSAVLPYICWHLR